MKINIKLKRAYKSMRNKRNAKYNISIHSWQVLQQERERGRGKNRQPNTEPKAELGRSYDATYREAI